MRLLARSTTCSTSCGWVRAWDGTSGPCRRRLVRKHRRESAEKASWGQCRRRCQVPCLHTTAPVPDPTAPDVGGQTDGRSDAGAIQADGPVDSADAEFVPGPSKAVLSRLRKSRA
jgi:hypothetical protein